MAVGDQLLTPASGHVRFELPGDCVKTTGTWATETNAVFSGGSDTYTSEVGATMEFVFSGTSIEILGYTDYIAARRQTTAQLWIDGVNAATISNYNASIAFIDSAKQRSVACVTGLTAGNHTGKIVSMETKYLLLDAIDVDTGCMVTQPTTTVTRRRCCIS